MRLQQLIDIAEEAAHRYSSVRVSAGQALAHSGWSLSQLRNTPVFMPQSHLPSSSPQPRPGPVQQAGGAVAAGLPLTALQSTKRDSLTASMNALQSRVQEAAAAVSRGRPLSPWPRDGVAQPYRDAQGSTMRKLDLNGTPPGGSVQHPEERRAYSDAFASLEADRQRQLAASAALSSARRDMDTRAALRLRYGHARPFLQ